MTTNNTANEDDETTTLPTTEREMALLETMQQLTILERERKGEQYET